MENNKFTILFSCIALVMFGCVTDPQNIPSGVTSDPVFSLAGSFGNEAIDIEAGRNSWTVQPIVYEQDSNFFYSSLFSKDRCLQDCSPSLEFKFYQQTPGSSDPSTVFHQTLKVGPVKFVGSEQERDSFKITLSTHPGLFMSGYSYWDDLNVPGTTFLAEYGSTIGYAENLNVCFQSFAFTGCQYSQCISFDPSTLIPCIAHIEAELENPQYVRLVARPEKGTPPFQFAWSNGYTTSTILIPLQDSTTEVFADVRITDGLGNISELKQTVRIHNGDVDACYFPISLVSEAINNSSPDYAAGKVELIYMDESGAVWSSTSGIQPLNTGMTILAVEAYGLSPAAQSTFKIRLDTNVELFNQSTGESKRLILQDAVIPLSHS